ncbi:glycerol kinase GlpK [Candidatus Poribacteria bacterium]
MKGNYILAIDQGTTGTTILLIDHEGQIAGRAYTEITQHYPRPGWVEHDPEEIWQKTLSTIEIALRSAEIKRDQIAAIGITNQRETSVVWDKRSGKPIHNAIVWQCRRTAEMCEQLRERGLTERVRRKTGLVIDPYFSATKLAWILKNIDGVRDSAQSGHMLFGTIDTWLIWKLTGGAIHVTDYTNASRTMLLNIHSLTWDEELLAELNIPATMLPEALPSSGHFGVVDCGSSALDGIPIAGDAGDQQAALFGQACFHPGSIKNTYGTGCFLMLNTGENSILSEHGLLTTIACGADGSPVYALEGSVFIAGAAVQWLRDGLGLIESASETESLAKSVPDTGGVYVVPAFTGLGAPHWDADARGAILGITRGTRREHIVRATLESIAYQTVDVMEAMRSDSGQEMGQLRVDGGAVANDFLMQFQSDVLGMEVNRPVMSETTALGAAFLAGLSVGFWEDESQLEKCRETDAIFRPELSPEQRTRLLSGWQKAVSNVMYGS